MATRLSGRGSPAAALFVVACFLVAPFIAFLAYNAEAGAAPWQVLRFPAFALPPLIALILVIWFVIGPSAAERAAIVAAAAMVVFFNYGALSDGLESAGLPNLMRLLIWVVVALLLISGAWIASRARPLIGFLATVGLFLVALPLVQYLASPGSDAISPPPADASAGPTFKRTPDIYYIVLDAYGRGDLLADAFGFDNSMFLNELKERGFRVVDDALAPYPLTFLSVASTLDMDYVVESAPDALGGGREPFYDRLRGDSVLHRRLEIEGYQHVSAPPGTWEGTECSGVEDLCVEPVSAQSPVGMLGEVEWGLVRMTPVGEAIDAFFTDRFARPFVDPSRVVRTVNEAGLVGPAFVQMHMLQTHPPFQFDEHCGPASSATTDLVGWPEESRPAYIDGIECANRQLLSAIDLMDDDDVVILLADHGPAFTLGLRTPFEDWTEETLRERYSILNAYRLPEDCRDMPPASSVNVFRVVVACLEGSEPELIDERWFFAGYREQTEVREMRGPPWRPDGESSFLRAG